MASPRSNFAHKLSDFPETVFANDQAYRHRGRWGDFFRQRIGPSFGGRIIFEVGCFDATYINTIAAQRPHSGFVGLDWKFKAIFDGAQRVAALGLKNVALVRERGQAVRRIFAANEVDEIWIFHPDPFASEPELKNRLIAEPFLIDAHAVLKPGTSTLTLKTDHPGYYQWVLGLFGLPEPDAFQIARHAKTIPAITKNQDKAALPLRVRASDLMQPQEVPAPSNAIRQRFRVLAHSPDFWHDPAVLAHTADRFFAGQPTLFERRFLRKRLPIYFLEVSPSAGALARSHDF